MADTRVPAKSHLVVEHTAERNGWKASLPFFGLSAYGETKDRATGMISVMLSRLFDEVNPIR